MKIQLFFLVAVAAASFLSLVARDFRTALFLH